MTRLHKTVIALIGIPILILIFFIPNIYGYFQFKSYCASEGGLRVYEQLEKNVGWQTDDYESAQMAAQINHVAFVRYNDKKDGNSYDLKFIGGYPINEKTFDKKPADEKRPVKYKYEDKNQNYKNELRLRKSSVIVTDVNTSKILVSYSWLNYSVYDRANTVLDGPSNIDCHVTEQKKNGNPIYSPLVYIDTAFYQ